MNTTNSLFMDTIDLLWNRPEVHLIGMNSDYNGSYSEEIDRDQAVDTDIDGDIIATFDDYRLECEPDDKHWIAIDFTAADMLAYMHARGLLRSGIPMPRKWPSITQKLFR